MLLGTNVANTWKVFLLLFLLLFETDSQFVSQADLELLVFLLPQPNPSSPLGPLKLGFQACAIKPGFLEGNLIALMLILYAYTVFPAISCVAFMPHLNSIRVGYLLEHCF